MKCFGEFECEIINGFVYLPNKFKLADKDVTSLVMEDEGITFIRICDELIDEPGEEQEQSSVILLENKRVHINKNGSFLVPEIFRQRMSLSKDTSVVVRGMGSAVEILTENASDEIAERMDAWINELYNE